MAGRHERGQVLEPVGVDAPDDRADDLGARGDHDDDERLRAEQRRDAAQRDGERDPGREAEQQLRAGVDLRVDGEQHADEREQRERAASTAELELVPGRHGRELEQGAAAARLGVAEVAALLVPRDLEQALLDAVVEPGAAEDELAQPVDERLALEQADALPVADEVAAERAPRLGDPAVRGELDQVGGLLLVEVVRRDQTRAGRRPR